MNAPKPEAFETLLARTINHATSTDPEYPGLYAETLAAYEAVTAERDAAVKERNAFARITKGAMLKPALVNGVGGFEVLPVQPDPRIEAWRALDAGDREEVIGSIIGDGAMHRDLHAIWAEEPNDGPDPKFLSMAAAYDAAAAALEALAERP